MLTLVYVQNEMYLIPTWKNNRIPNYANQNSDLMSFQQQYSQKNPTGIPESETNQNSASDGGPRNWNQKLEFPT